jgi:hypothetical protein
MCDFLCVRAIAVCPSIWGQICLCWVLVLNLKVLKVDFGLCFRLGESDG